MNLWLSASAIFRFALVFGLINNYHYGFSDPLPCTANCALLNIEFVNNCTPPPPKSSSSNSSSFSFLFLFGAWLPGPGVLFWFVINLNLNVVDHI